MAINISIDCPMCPGALSIPIAITLGAPTPGSGSAIERNGRSHAVFNIKAEITPEGHELIAEHVRIAHPDV